MNISVAAFYLLNEAALGVVGVAHERPITDVIGNGEDKCDDGYNKCKKSEE